MVFLIVLFDAAANFSVVWVKWDTVMWCAVIALGGMLGQIKFQRR